ncbi:MAG: FIG01121484: hypothetical protein, partial [uncultured Blastococcus sp.]
AGASSRRRPGRTPGEPADPVAQGDAGRAVPAHLDRRRRGRRDRLRAAGRPPGAADDPRPAPGGRERARRHTGGRQHHRDARRHLHRRAGVRRRAGGQRPPVGRRRPGRAHRCADLRRGRAARRGGHRDPGRAGGRGREVPRVPRPDLTRGLRRRLRIGRPRL